MSEYRLTIDNQEVVWNEATLRARLFALKNLNHKSAGWIGRDLVIHPSSWLSRLFWTLVAKHFHFLREAFYGVNLKQSQNILFQLEGQISKKHDLRDLLAGAMASFDRTAKGYQVSPIYSSPRKSPSPKSPETQAITLFARKKLLKTPELKDPGNSGKHIFNGVRLIIQLERKLATGEDEKLFFVAEFKGKVKIKNPAEILDLFNQKMAENFKRIPRLQYKKVDESEGLQIKTIEPSRFEDLDQRPFPRSPMSKSLRNRSRACIEQQPVKLYKALSGSPLPSIRQIMSEFQSQQEIDERLLQDLFQIHNQKFPLKYNPQTEHGILEKRDLPSGAKVFVSGDLHGGVESLMEDLYMLQEQGLLNDEFAPSPDFYMVLCGDFGDKGKHTLQVLKLVMTLRLLYPEQVFLLKGNHDDLEINILEHQVFSNDLSFQHFLGYSQEGNKESIYNQMLLSEFYQTLTLGLYLSENTTGKREYVEFAHAIPELYFDPNELLNSDQTKAVVALPKSRGLSERFELSKEKVLKIVRRDLARSSYSHTATTFCWGSITPLKSFMGNPSQAQWRINPSDLREHQKLCSSEHKIKLLFYSHQHVHQHYKIRGTTRIISLPARDNTYYPVQEDVTYILKTAPKVKEWTRQVCKRILKPGTTAKVSALERLQERSSRLEHLILKFQAHWNPETKLFEGLKFNKDKFIALVQEYHALFGVNYDDNRFHGEVIKRILPPDSKIFVHADLHGDLKSLLESLQAIIKQGLFDDCYFVFLGDYLDRGSHIMEVLELLINLKLAKKDRVILLRGNHEDTDINKDYLDSTLDINFRNFFNDYDNQELLTNFYKTLPLSAYLGTENEEGRVEFVHFTHGMFELHPDVAEILDTDEPSMLIPKRAGLSARITSLEVDFEVDYIDGLNLTQDKLQRRELKLLQAAKVIKAHWEKEKDRRSDLTAYNWGDVGEESRFGSLGQREWSLTPEDIYHYMRLSSEKNAVKLLIRGHEHLIQHHTLQKQSKKGVKTKLIATTMSIGMDVSAHYVNIQFPDQLDTGYILTTSPKVREWTKRAVLRQPGGSHVQITEPYPIRSLDV
jgi:hypothetical protein